MTYIVTITALPATGTQPLRVHASGLAALDVLDWLPKMHPPAISSITIPDRGIVALADVVSAAQEEATTPELRKRWVNAMCQALLHELHGPPPGPDPTSAVPQEQDWVRAGRWWACTTARPLDRDVLAHMRVYGERANAKERHHGLRILEHAAAAKRLGENEPVVCARSGPWISTDATIAARMLDRD
ncbi:hypothetical protein [Amycolatopsis sp. NPDC059657]|uniref:hypothetical protein n=1 Tax=Amycolatopsis sp. NPDC059657 TaxID=3346899 RepID=UPI0036720744